jgi:hypothetical protein
MYYLVIQRTDEQADGQSYTVTYADAVIMQWQRSKKC